MTGVSIRTPDITMGPDSLGFNQYFILSFIHVSCHVKLAQYCTNSSKMLHPRILDVISLRNLYTYSGDMRDWSWSDPALQRLRNIAGMGDTCQSIELERKVIYGHTLVVFTK